MTGEQDMQILNALIELKNQIVDLRTVLAASDDDNTEEETDVLSHTSNHPSNNEEYRIEITPQEINELLFSSPVSPPPHHSSVSCQKISDEITNLSKDFFRFRERTEQEISDLKKSVVTLSEMFGRHELELQKNQK